MAVSDRDEWPGNGREVENMIVRAVTLSASESITPEDLPETITAGRKISFRPDKSLKSVLLDSEYRHITAILDDVEGDKKAAATILGISLPSLYRKLEHFKKIRDDITGLAYSK